VSVMGGLVIRLVLHAFLGYVRGSPRERLPPARPLEVIGRPAAMAVVSAVH